MAGAGALFKTSGLKSGLGDSDRVQNQGGLRRLNILLGGVLGVLLLSTSTQAKPLLLEKGEPFFTVSERVASEVAQSLIVEEGIYFYGQAPRPDEIGAAYMVFEAQGAQVVGAMFMPHSSFDCFQGRVDGSELALNITNSYTQETYDYAIAITPIDEPIATIGNAPVPIELDGFFDLGAARDAELSILATCQADLQ